MAGTPLPLFPNYLQMRERARPSAKVWTWARIVTLVIALAHIGILLIAPSAGLTLFWKLTVPMLPVVFLVTPGLWRNLCPLATANQMPRVFHFGRALTPPDWFQEYGYVIGAVGFFILVSTRKWLFNSSGPATACLVVSALILALVGGYLFKGKSGWCSSICPLYPVQRLYNQTPFVTIPNAHCSTCVGCTKNCYDFNPPVANLADLYDDDPYRGKYRKVFAASMPGLVFAYYTLPDATTGHSVLTMYVSFLEYLAISIGLYFVIESFTKISGSKIIALYSAIAINVFYYFALPKWLSTVANLWDGSSPTWIARALQVGLFSVTIVWIVRTFRKEPLFLGQLAHGEETRVSSAAARVLKHATGGDKPTVEFLPDGTRVVADKGRTILEVAEANNQKIEAGCRMGVCGADPIIILSGMENLPPLSSDEKSTLERLGLGSNCRLACMCRVNGPVSVATDIQESRLTHRSDRPTPPDNFDRSIKQIVIVGNGIAGVTAAEYARRNHPECEIHVVGREKHPLYNRMAISRLIYGRSAMNGLYLQPPEWYEERNITQWLNTRVTRISRSSKSVGLATGEELPFDRLILTSGSSSAVPPIAGYDLPGAFVLREADDAMGIRAYVQEHDCRRALVGGGGLLGLEAAFALHNLGLRVTVLERGDWLLRRQLDERGAQFLKRYLEGLRLQILYRAEIRSITGEGRVQQARLTDGRELPCDLLLAAVGMVPNLELAQGAALESKRGLLVNSHMQTNDPAIFGAGDVCEFDGQILGLWPVAVEQARVAAINALGGQVSYQAAIPVTTLKVVGIDLTSIGRFDAQSAEDVVIVLEDIDNHHYRKLVLSEGKIVGAILLGYPLEATVVATAVKEEWQVSEYIEDLRTGNWNALSDRAT